MLLFLRKLLGLTSKPVAAIEAPAEGRTDTEFACEVVRITELLPHPNADRLELARFEMASGPSDYTVVVRKGEYWVGDKAVYLSVDCVVPLDHKAFKFLGERLDGAGKTHYRLRAARLRGVFSQGLLVSSGRIDRGVGEQLAAEWGITYHRAPEPEDKRPTAPSAKPKKQPFPIYAIDSLKKVPNLFGPDERVFITEKIHGTNFRFGWARRRLFGTPWGWRFVVGSHRVIKEGGELGFYKEDLWHEAARRMGLAGKTKAYKGYAFYGELFGYTYGGKRIQDLTYGCTPGTGPGFALFDVRLPDGRYMDPDARVKFCRQLDLPHVPVLYTHGTGSGIFSALAEGRSAYDGSQIREGIVVESVEGDRRKAKYVSQSYLLRDEGHYGPDDL